MTLTVSRPVGLGWFVGLTALMLAVMVGLVRQPVFVTQTVLPAAVTVDLLVTLPVLFYPLVARPFQLPMTSVGAVWGGALALGHWLIPAPQQRYLGWASQGLVLVEIVAVTTVVIRVRRLVRAYAEARTRGSDFVDNLSEAFGAVFSWPTGLLVSEVAMVRYGLCSVGAKVEVAPDQRAFSVHRESGFRAMVLTLLALSILETAVVHLVVRRWSPTAALVLLAASAYGVVFLLAHLRAVVLRPVTLSSGRLGLRVGFFWRLSVPLADVREVAEISEAPARGEPTLDMAQPLLTAPNLRLSFTGPVVVAGLYGARRTVTSVTLHVDDRDGLARALRQAR